MGRKRGADGNSIVGIANKIKIPNRINTKTTESKTWIERGGKSDAPLNWTKKVNVGLGGAKRLDVFAEVRFFYPRLRS